MPRSTPYTWTIAALAAMTVLVAGLTLAARQRTSDKIVLKLAHGLDSAHPVHISMVFMAKRVHEMSAGAMEIEIFPSEQLGSERECIEQVQLGSLEMTKASSAAVEQFIPEMGVFGLPYLFRDDEHYWNVLNGPIGQEILSAGQRVGLHGLCYFDAGARSFYTKDRPVAQPSDLRGLKIRVQQSRMAMDMIDALGAAPTPIPFGELYTALQQGVVDAAENNPPSLLTSRHYEVCKYYTLDQHTLVPDVLLISEAVWRDLPPEMQGWLNEAAAEAAAFQRKLWATKTAEALEELKKAGVEVTYPDKQLFSEAVASMLHTQSNPTIQSLVDRILAQ